MSASPTFSVRHVQLARALFAATAALMITFSPDHSATVGLSVFSGFALVTALILGLAAWLVAPAGNRWPYVLLAAISTVAGLAGGVPIWRSTPLFFVLVIAWGALGGLVELLAGLRERRRARAAGTEPADGTRDAILIGALGLLLAIALLCVPMGYAWNYSIAEAGSFTLTGITLAVGILGIYAAIVAVFLGIAGFTPRPAARGDEASADAVSAAHEQGGPA